MFRLTCFGLRNAAADLGAKIPVHRFAERSREYQQIGWEVLFAWGCCQKGVEISSQSRVALCCSAHAGCSVRCPSSLKLDDPVYLAPLVAEADVVCPELAAMLKNFFHELQWIPTGDNGALSDTSLLELCVLSIRAIGVLPPFFCGGKWRLVGADPLASVVDLDVVRLFRTWKRIFCWITFWKCSFCDVDVGSGFAACWHGGHGSVVGCLQLKAAFKFLGCDWYRYGLIARDQASCGASLRCTVRRIH